MLLARSRALGLAASAAARPRQEQQQQQRQQQPRRQKQQQRPPDGQDAESRSFRRLLRFPAQLPPELRGAGDDGEPVGRRASHRAAVAAARRARYGLHAGDADVRRYIALREANEARPRASRRGRFPLDDSFEAPAAFLKLSEEFQRTVLNERSSALVDAVPRLPLAAAWQLYTAVPGLLTLMTLEVAQRLHGLAHATGLELPAVAAYLCSFRRLAFVGPDTVASRVGLLAKVARLPRHAAVRLMMQQPQLWLLSSKALAPRAEQLALLLCCCTVTAVRLIGSCPALLDAPLSEVQQQLAGLCQVLGAPPHQVVPLLLWQPALLLRQPPQEQPAQEQPPQEQPPQEQPPQEQPPQEQLQVVAQQLSGLAAALQLPSSMLQQVVLSTPDLLPLGAPPAAGGAALAALAAGWLCTPAAVAARQQYRRQLLALLAPPRQGRLRKPAEQAGGCYTAAGAAAAAAIDCQWWAQPQAAREDAASLPALQQLVLHAPALLLVAAPGAVRGPHQPPADPLQLRLQQLAQHLLPLVAPQSQPGQSPDERLLGQLRQAATLEPALLARPPAFVASQLAQLAQALLASPAELWPLLAPHCPGALWLTPVQVFARVRVLCGVLRLPAASVRQRLLSPEAVPVLLLAPEAAQAAVPAAGGDVEAARRAAASSPALLLPGHAADLRRVATAAARGPRAVT